MYPAESSRLVSKWQRIVNAFAGTSFGGLEWCFRVYAAAFAAMGIVMSPIMVAVGMIAVSTPIKIDKYTALIKIA